MSIPDFERAQYVEPQVIEGYAGDFRPQAASAFPRAILYGVVAALVGSIVYALIGLSGWMVSIVAIGVAILIGKAMMTATGGVGGRPLQIAACILLYLAVSFADVLDLVYYAHRDRDLPVGHIVGNNIPLLLKVTLIGPFLELSSGFNGIIGLVIIAIGMRTAWRLAAGSPGFGGTGGSRPGVFGLR